MGAHWSSIEVERGLWCLAAARALLNTAPPPDPEDLAPCVATQPRIAGCISQMGETTCHPTGEKADGSECPHS
jgi:hypothetical protein